MKSHTSVWLGIVVCSLAFVAMTRSARMMNRDSRDDRVNVEGSSPYRNTKPKRSRGRFIKPFSSSLRWGYQPLGFEDEGGGEGYDPDGGSVLGVIGSQCRDEFNTGISALSSPRGTDDAFLLYGPGSPASPLSWLTSSPLIRSDVKSLRVSRHTAKEGSLFSQASTGEIANIQVNDPAMDQTALQGFHNQSETTVAVFGQHVAVSFNETARGTSGSYGISSDGGATFVHKRLPAADNNGTNGGDGVVAFGPSGELYYSALAFKGTTGQNSVIVARSDDFGQTFSVVDASTTAATAPAFQDKPYMTVDARPQSPFKGNVYVSWTDFSRGPQGTFILFARSTDGGKTYGPPVPLSPQENGLALGGAFPVVGPNGDLFVVYCDLNGHHLHFSLVRSTDGGASFGSPATIFTFDPAFFVVNMLTGGAGGVRTPPFPFLAIDATGTLHLVFQARLIKPGGRDRSNVYYSRSTDSGATWVAPVQLNDDATTTSQSFPTVAVTRDGTIGVKWWDRRDDPIHDSLTGVYMTLSKDGGLTWSQNFRVTDHNWVFGPGDRGASPLYHGDYDGMCASGNNFLLSWSDERNGNGDVFFAKVPSNRDPKAADFNISAAKLYDSVVAGKSVEFQMNTNAVNGFSGDLTIGVSPAIDGLSYQTSSSTIAVGQPVTVTVSVGARVAPGPYLIDVQASAGGLTRQTNFTFTVYDPKGPAAPPVNATGTPGFTNMESGLKVDSNGTLHLVYDDDALGGEVYSTQSTDDGLTFSAPLRLTVDTDPGSPFGNEAAFSTLAIDNADNLYAAWVGRDAATQSMPIFLTLSTDHGATFSKPLPVTPPSEQPIHPIVAVDSKSGTILITYQNFVLGQSPSATLGIESLDGGKTFSSPFQISLTGEVMGNPPFCAFDQTGAAYVVYQVAGTAMDFVRIAVASDGQHFGPPKTISDPRILSSAPQICIDPAGKVFVAYYAQLLPSTGISIPNNEIMVVQSSDGGATFSSPLNASNTAGSSAFPSIAANGQGNVTVAWEDTTGNNDREIFVSISTDGGATFSASINLSRDPGLSFSAFCAAGPDGKMFAGWTDDSGFNTDIYASLAPASGAPLPPPPPPQPSDFTVRVVPPTITVTRPGTVSMIVLIDRTGGLTDTITVPQPDLSLLRVKKVAFIRTGDIIRLKFKLTAGGPTGTKQITFTGTDSQGRTRQATETLQISPST